jgi:hypothetical protein
MANDVRSTPDPMMTGPLDGGHDLVRDDFDRLCNFRYKGFSIWSELAWSGLPSSTECFARAFDLALILDEELNSSTGDRQEVWLTHGSTRRLAHHAWVEFAGMVFDPATGYGYSSRSFASILETDARVAYSPPAAAELALRYGNPGPWPEGEVMRRAEAEPLRMSLADVRAAPGGSIPGEVRDEDYLTTSRSAPENQKVLATIRAIVEGLSLQRERDEFVRRFREHFDRLPRR